MFPKDPFDVFQKGFQLFKTSAAVVLQMNILLHLAHANELVNGKKGYSSIILRNLCLFLSRS